MKYSERLKNLDLRLPYKKKYNSHENRLKASIKNMQNNLIMRSSSLK